MSIPFKIMNISRKINRQVYFFGKTQGAPEKPNGSGKGQFRNHWCTQYMCLIAFRELMKKEHIYQCTTSFL